MRWFISGMFLSSLSATPILAQSLTVDKNTIRFAGLGCGELTADSVSIKDGRMIINLEGMPAARAEKSKLSCLITIPYSEGKGKSTWVLSGEYGLSDKDYVALTVRVDPQGGIDWGSILNISDSPRGKFTVQNALFFDGARTVEGLLRISLTGNLKTYPSQSSRPASEAKLAFHQLTLSDVKDGTKTVN